MMEAKMRFISCLAIATLLLLQGCATVTVQDLKANTAQSETWEVDAPIERVYRAYKEYAENEIAWAGFLGGGGIRISGGLLNNQAAEITARQDDAPGVGRKAWLHLELSHDGEKTKMTAWYYNAGMKKKIDELKHLPIP